MREADISGIALEPWGDEDILDILSKVIADASVRTKNKNKTTSGYRLVNETNAS